MGNTRMKYVNAFVPTKHSAKIEEYAKEHCHPRRYPGGWRGLVPQGETPSISTVTIEITEEPHQAGDMRHVYKVPLSEIARR